MMMKSRHGVLWLGIQLLLLLATGAATGEDRLQFNRDIRPILAANCFPCHGFDAKQRKADLRLDVAEGAFADLGGRAAILPGDPERSELVRRIESTDPDEVMPPPDSKKSLTAAQKATLRTWIAQGAPYQKHWAFERPAAVEPPRVERSDWVRNPIDAFIVQKLEQEGLTPQPEADRETLIRRVALAVTGLPPTPAEVDAFVDDARPDAYERMVDHFLASRHYGEERARHWLDLARYADTHGLHLDNEREMWLYRDWVVRAFNDNLPYDQFVVWQLAGDLLPNPTLDQLIATGFNRCNVSTSEGGSIEAEWVYRNAVDRTSTMVETFLGLTGGCAVCHDHKYDPLTMKEFYSLYAFFYSAADPGLDGNVRDTPPFLKVPTPEQAARLAELKAKENEALKGVQSALRAMEYRDPAETLAVERTASGPASAEGSGDSEPPAATSWPVVTDTILDDDFPLGSRVTNTSRNAADWAYDPDFGVKSGKRALEMSSTSDYDVTIQFGTVPFQVPEEGTLSFWLRIDRYYPPSVLSIRLHDGHVQQRAVWGDAERLPDKSNAVGLGDLPAAGTWTRLEVPLEKLKLTPGAILKSLVLTQVGGRVWIDQLQITGRHDPAKDPRASLHAWWRLGSQDKPSGVPAEVQAALKTAPDATNSEDQRATLLRYFVQYVQRESESPIREPVAAWRQAQVERVAWEETIPGTLIFRELEKPRDAFVMVRGQYDKPGEPVVPDVPAVFPPLPTGSPAGQPPAPPRRATRLDLARWLVSPEHPLTARVMVNHLWQQLFGTGLVKTSFDFGSQGELPSHPELLDWLAVRYREEGWDTKRLLRLMLTSSTFRQRSVANPELLRRDPDNRWLARGPRLRLDAEIVRDQALFVSGLLSPHAGGRGVFPYQPPNIWEPVGYENSNTRFYMQDHGEKLYRRSLYCFLKRTAPPPFMSNFDAPNRESFCARRERSNTPLQALQTMNDIQHFEAARVLAERVLIEGGTGDNERLDFLYRVVLSRRPDDGERQLLTEALATQRALFDEDPEGAERAIRVGESPLRPVAPPPELAAWTMMANLVLNLDEAIMRN